MAVAYIRVSTTSQKYSMVEQREACEGWCKLYNVPLRSVYKDFGISGAKVHRQGLTMALSALRKGDVLIVHSITRLTRNLSQASALCDKLHENGNGIIAISESIDTRTENGKLVLGIMATLSTYERDVIARRVKHGMAEARSKGKYIGRTPYGYARKGDGSLEKEPSEWCVVEDICNLYQKGVSLGDIARVLNERGTFTKKGCKWNKITVKLVLGRCKLLRDNNVSHKDSLRKDLKEALRPRQMQYRRKHLRYKRFSNSASCL